MLKKMWFVMAVCVLVIGGTLCFAEEASVSLDLNHTIGKLGNVLSSNLDSSSCLGTPVIIGDLTLIPVVSKGFGFGIGGGMHTIDEAVSNQDKVAKEATKDHQGLGCGAGGVVRTIAIILIKKDGTFQIHRMQENFMAQVVKQLIPVIQNAIAKNFEFKLLKFNKTSPDSNPPAAPGMPPQGR